jgi:hypothetical protein
MRWPSTVGYSGVNIWFAALTPDYVGSACRSSDSVEDRVRNPGGLRQNAVAGPVRGPVRESRTGQA